jgi:hypothetical protein
MVPFLVHGAESDIYGPMGLLRYYWQLLRVAFVGAWGVADTGGGLLALAAALLIHFKPD